MVRAQHRTSSTLVRPSPLQSSPASNVSGHDPLPSTQRTIWTRSRTSSRPSWLKSHDGPAQIRASTTTRVAIWHWGTPLPSESEPSRSCTTRCVTGGGTAPSTGSSTTSSTGKGMQRAFESQRIGAMGAPCSANITNFAPSLCGSQAMRMPSACPRGTRRVMRSPGGLNDSVPCTPASGTSAVIVMPTFAGCPGPTVASHRPWWAQSVMRQGSVGGTRQESFTVNSRFA